ncbi:MAG: hypothetical protein JJ863_21815 [Deltaproteobacteria bacterium]|nr:hypothetical protein [Deltaproteobacteria bacterium]
MLSLLGCHEDFMALDRDAGPDAGREDATPPVDLGPPIPQVTVAPFVAGGGDSVSGGWLLVADEASGDEFVFTLGLREVLQASGPDLVDLPGTHAVTGVRSAGTEAFSWLAYSDEADVQALEGGEDFLWLHLSSAEPRGVNGTTTTGPKLMRLFYDGTVDMEIPVPAGVRLSFVGDDSAGDEWLLGSGTGPVIVDGTSLGETGQTIAFLARMTPAALVDPVLIATGGATIGPFTSARLLADGDLLASVQTNASGGTVAGEATIPNSIRLVKIDLAGPTIIDEWMSTRFVDVYETDAGIELRAQAAGSSITLGAHTYVPTDGVAHVRVAWDPVTEPDIPEGEQWPVVPEEVQDGLHVGSSASFGEVEIFTVLDDDRSIVRRVKTDGQILERSVRWDGGVFTGVLIHEEETGELIVEGAGAGTQTLGDVVSGNQSFWVLQLDTATGEVIHRKGYDAGPMGGERARVHAQPLTEDLFLVAIWTGSGATTLMVDGWVLPEPIDIPVTTTGAECQVWPSGRSFSFPRVVTFEPTAFALTAICDGPHTVSVDDASFELGTNESSSLFRVQVD